MTTPRKYWLKLNDQATVRFDEPLNPGFVFWLRRRYRARVASDGGERVTVTRHEPFSEKELEEIYCETEYRQQKVVFYQSQNVSSKAVRPLKSALYWAGKSPGSGLSNG